MKPIILLGEAFGSNEVRTQSAFVGASGIELLKLLDEAGILALTSTDLDYIRNFWNTSDPHHIDMVWRLHPEVYRTNVFNLHPPGNNLEALCGPRTEAIRGYPALLKAKYLRAEFQTELDRLAIEINQVDPNLVICLGNTPLWALAGKTGVSKLRGTTLLSTHTVADFKLLSTYHPAAVLRQWELRSTTVIDLMKAVREAEYPEIRRPPREIWIEPTVEDIIEFRDRYIRDARILSVDIETAGNRITCIGFAPSIDRALVVPFDDERRKDRSYWASADIEKEVWEIVRGILLDSAVKKVFQNGMYDIAFLWRSMGLKVYGAVEDTMLLHHALQPEALKRLDFLGSLYTDEGAWKAEHRASRTIKRDA